MELVESMQLAHRRFLEFIRRLLLKLLNERVKRTLMEEKEGIDPDLLDRAIESVQRKVNRIFSGIPTFDADALLSKIPSLEFLELLAISEYLYLQSVERTERTRRGRQDLDLMNALKKMMNAYGVYTQEEVETFRGTWKEAWSTVDEKRTSADASFEQFRTTLPSNADL